MSTDPDNSGRAFEDALSALERLDAPEEQQAAVSLLSVWGQTALAEDEPGRAVPCFRALADFSSRTNGADHERTLVWRGFLGRALTDSGSYTEAEQVLSDLLLDRERLLGPDDALTLVTRGNLARAIALGGRPDEGVLLAQRLLDDRLRLLGPEHPSTLDSQGHLAHFHLLAGRAELAASLYAEQLAARLRTLEPDDPVLDQTRHNLALALDRAAPEDADAEYLGRLVRQLTDLVGNDHDRTLRWTALLAMRLCTEGRYAEDRKSHV